MTFHTNKLQVFIATLGLILLFSQSQAQEPAFFCSPFGFTCENLNFFAPGLCTYTQTVCSIYEVDPIGTNCCIYDDVLIWSYTGPINSTFVQCEQQNKTIVRLIKPTGSNDIELMIDNFITPMSIMVEATAPVSDGASVAAATALGGERDLWVEKTQGSDGERIRVRVNPFGEQKLRQGTDDANGKAVLTYDGYDGTPQPNQVNYTGLGSIDFSVYSAIEIGVSFSDLTGPVHVTFWDGNDPSGNTFATGTVNIPENTNPSNTVVKTSTLLSSFTATGAPLANILDSVGAVQVNIDGTAPAQNAWDYSFDYIRLIGIGC